MKVRDVATKNKKKENFLFHWSYKNDPAGRRQNKRHLPQDWHQIKNDNSSKIHEAKDG